MYRAISICLVLLGLGCTSWRTTTIPLPQLVSGRQPGWLRVTTDSGTRVVVHDPQVVGDTLAGHVVTGPGTHTSVHVPLSAVRRVERRQFDGQQTSELLLATALSAGIIGVVWVGKSFDSWSW